MKKLKIIILIVILLVVLFILYKYKNALYTLFIKEVQVINVERKNLDKTIEKKGTIKGVDDASVYSYARRKVINVFVQEGDRVHIGDKLCEIKSNYDDAYIEKAKLDVDDAKYIYNIKSSLYKSGDISDKEFREVESNLKKAELNLKYIEEENNFIESPIEGTVTRVDTEVGKIPLTTESIFTIENIDELEMKLEINENDIGFIKKGQSVKIKTKIFDEYVYGSIKKISLSAEDKKGNTSEKIIPVYVKINNPNHKIISGITGEAEIITESVKNVLTIPSKCLITNESEKYLYIVKNGVVSKTNVDVIFDNGLYIAIKDNNEIKEGEEVVISPSKDLQDRQKVIIK